MHASALLFVAQLLTAGSDADAKHPLAVTIVPNPAQLSAEKPPNVQIKLTAQTPPATMPILYAQRKRVDLSRAEDGWKALLPVPRKIRPQFVVVFALHEIPHRTTPQPQVVSAVARFSAPTVLKGRTEPKANMRIDVAGRVFGPVRANDEGRFELPIVVPPGVTRAKGISSDLHGNEARSIVKLVQPPFRPLRAVVHPSSLVADGESTAVVMAQMLREDGSLISRSVTARAKRGEVRTIRNPTAVRVFRYTAPAGIGDGTDTIHLRSGQARQELTIGLHAGKPHRIDVVKAAPSVAANGKDTSDMVIQVLDRWDSPVKGLLVFAKHQKRVLATGIWSDSNYRLQLKPRDTVATLELTVEVRAEHDQKQPTASTQTQATWHYPTPVTLVLHLHEKKNHTARLRLESKGIPSASKRVQFTASSGSLDTQVDQNGTTWLLARGGTRPLDIVATDTATGVSAWLRVP